MTKKPLQQFQQTSSCVYQRSIYYALLVFIKWEEKGSSQLCTLSWLHLCVRRAPTSIPLLLTNKGRHLSTMHERRAPKKNDNRCPKELSLDSYLSATLHCVGVGGAFRRRSSLYRQQICPKLHTLGGLSNKESSTSLDKPLYRAGRARLKMSIELI